MDEDTGTVKTDEFAAGIRDGDTYFLIITREGCKVTAKVSDIYDERFKCM